MANKIANTALGRYVEKFADDTAKIGVLLLQVTEGDTVIVDHETVADLLGGSNTECNFTNYARETAITGTITVDDTNDRVDVDIPDITITSAGGASNNSIVRVVVFQEETASDAGRMVISVHDATATTDGTNLTLNIATAGILRSQQA